MEVNQCSIKEVKRRESRGSVREISSFPSFAWLWYFEWGHLEHHVLETRHLCDSKPAKSEQHVEV